MVADVPGTNDSRVDRLGHQPIGTISRVVAQFRWGHGAMTLPLPNGPGTEETPRSL